MPVRWRLKETLKTENISVYRLAMQMGGEAKRPALHAITSEDPEKQPKRVTFDMLENVAAALHDLTGKTYKVGDLIEFTDTDAPTADAEKGPDAEGER